MEALPSGTVTFLFTDVEGSTRLLDRLGAALFEQALREHRSVAREVFAAHGGVEVDTQGDSFFVAFERAGDAVSAAAALTERLREGPIRVRVGIHTGEPLLSDQGYVGMDVHRAARIAAVGHGGQVLVSQTTRDLVADVALCDLGDHRLKDLTRPERLFQLGEGAFPPLKSLNRTNLPIAAGPLLGRERELVDVVELISQGHRLVTLTGAGGSGKTRLALQIAAEVVEEFPDGVFFVSLAPLSDEGRVEGAIAEAIGLFADEDVFARLAQRRTLLVLDNAEHLDLGALVGRLLDAARRVVVVATSRVPLHLSSEYEVPVEPLDQKAAAELFVTRAAAAGVDVAADEVVAEICRKLDCLPLAVELAAARVKVLSPQVLLARLGQALQLLTGGPRDAPERQQTLEATIAWSYDLLDDEGRTALRRLAVFRGGIRFDAAEQIAGVDLEMLTALADHSLLKRLGDDGRVLLLETIREFAAERLADSGEESRVREAHARWYLDRIREFATELRGPRTRELLAWYEQEAANTWAALDTFSDHDPEAALSLANELARYWIAQGRMREGRLWLEHALAQDGPPSSARAQALARVGDLADRLGDLAVVEGYCQQAVQMAREVEDDETLALALGNLAWLHKEQHDYTEARRLAEEALEAATRTGSPFHITHAQTTLASAFKNLGQLDEAEHLYRAAMETCRALGDQINVALALTNLGSLALDRSHYQDAISFASEALDILATLGGPSHAVPPLLVRGLAALASANSDAALNDYTEALHHASKTGQELQALECVGGIAAAARNTDPTAATKAWAAYLAGFDRRGALPDRDHRAVGERLVSELAEAIGEAAATEARTQGASLTDQQAIALALSLAQRSGIDTPSYLQADT